MRNPSTEYSTQYTDSRSFPLRKFPGSCSLVNFRFMTIMPHICLSTCRVQSVHRDAVELMLNFESNDHEYSEKRPNLCFQSVTTEANESDYSLLERRSSPGLDSGQSTIRVDCCEHRLRGFRSDKKRSTKLRQSIVTTYSSAWCPPYSNGGISLSAALQTRCARRVPCVASSPCQKCRARPGRACPQTRAPGYPTAGHVEKQDNNDSSISTQMEESTPSIMNGTL